MAKKSLGFVALVALVTVIAIPALTQVAYAGGGAARQSSVALGPGVTYGTYVDSAPTNVIHVTTILGGSRATIKAVVAPADSHGATLATVAALCQQANALVCVNGDFFTPRGASVGGELVDGHWIRQATGAHQQLWLDTHNQFRLGRRPANAVHSLGATSYAILLPGRPIAIPEHNNFADGDYARTLIGWNARGDRFFVTVEHNRRSHGMSLAQAAALMRRIGATTAVNDDGGGSSQMVVNAALQGPSGTAGRRVANIWAVVA